MSPQHQTLPGQRPLTVQETTDSARRVVHERAWLPVVERVRDDQALSLALIATIIGGYYNV